MKKLLIFYTLLVFAGLITACSETAASPTETLPPPTTTSLPPTSDPPQEPDQPYELVEYINYKSTQKLHVYTPTGVEIPYPTVVNFRGLWGSQYDIQALAIYLAERGYATVSVDLNYDGTKYAYDAACALGWIFANADQFHLDPTRIALFGVTQGGLAASLLGANQNLNPFLVDCEHTLPPSYQAQGVVTWESFLVARNGVLSREEDTSAQAAYWGVSEASYANLWQTLNATPPQDWEALTGELGEDVQEYLRILSLRYVDDSDPPFFFLIGTNLGKAIEAESYAVDVQAIGGDAAVVVIEGVDQDDYINPNNPNFPLIAQEVETYLAKVLSE